MIAMIGSQPVWCCDTCGDWLKEGIVLYSAATITGHFPTPRICCGEACAVIAEDRLTVTPVVRMPWGEFLKAVGR